jgi:hypothetical protein
VQGTPGQQYLVSLGGSAIEYFVLHLQMSIPGEDPFTASQQSRIYIEQNQFPPPSVTVTSSNGASFVAHIMVSGYLVDVP